MQRLATAAVCELSNPNSRFAFFILEEKPATFCIVSCFETVVSVFILDVQTRISISERQLSSDLVENVW